LGGKANSATVKQPPRALEENDLGGRRSRGERGTLKRKNGKASSSKT